MDRSDEIQGELKCGCRARNKHPQVMNGRFEAFPSEVIPWNAIS